ncbi:Zinc finger protein 420 [Fukomys damarensis]|uniref:Zinc finger protein 420 n=1 Tax=Fukomys damarensis TaxID=885580 RepID=A0A091D3G0_FUKDA|nr:Zinc finger protein 420 [Fukomys damarensis]
MDADGTGRCAGGAQPAPDGRRQLRNLLLVPAPHKLLVLAGPCLEETGELLLQTGGFSFHHFLQVLDEREVTLVPTFESVAMRKWFEETSAQQQALGVRVLGSSSMVFTEDEAFPACKLTPALWTLFLVCGCPRGCSVHSRELSPQPLCTTNTAPRMGPESRVRPEAWALPTLSCLGHGGHGARSCERRVCDAGATVTVLTSTAGPRGLSKGSWPRCSGNGKRAHHRLTSQRGSRVCPPSPFTATTPELSQATTVITAALPVRRDLGGDLGGDIGRLPGVEPPIEAEETGSNTAIIRKGETKSPPRTCAGKNWEDQNIEDENSRRNLREDTEQEPYVYEEYGEMLDKYEEPGNAFRFPQWFHIYERTPAGEKPYESEPGDNFRCLSTLQNHEKILFGEKQHEYKQCGTLFRSHSYVAKLVSFSQTQDQDPDFLFYILQDRLWAQKPSEVNSGMAASVHDLPRVPGVRLHLPAAPLLSSWTYHAASMLGLAASKPHLISRLEQSEEPWNVETRGTAARHPGIVKSHSKYTEHQRICAGKKLHKCKECGRAFSKPSNLSKHHRIHTGEKPYKCKECGRAFNVSSNLTQHQRIHTGEKPYQCNECGRAFRMSSNLTRHRKIHSGERRYQCKECDKTFHAPFSLTRHQRVHAGEKLYKCEECGKGFDRSSRLTQHQRAHSDEKPYKCEQCGKAFDQCLRFIHHLRVHTGEKAYTCEECGKTFDRISRLIRHLRFRTGEKPYKCKECGKTYDKNCRLTQHQRVHNIEKPYKCQECGKAFNQSSRFIQHQRVHTGEGLYKCEGCSKTFGQISRLIQHQRIHDDEKPYQCEQCGKAFGRSSRLSQHQKIHTGEKPYKCKECGRGFHQNLRFIQHQRVHIGENPYKCEECGKSFDRSSRLIQHQRIHSRKNLTSVKIVAQPLVSTQTLPSTAEYTPERTLPM